jgi:hypothetical protein
MTDHRYPIGSRVRIVARLTPIANDGDVYTIVRQLPPQGDGDRQYRVKSERQSYERVVVESQLAEI